MARYFLDTNICIDFLRGRMPKALEMFRQTPVEAFALPAIVEAELRLGAAKQKNPQTFQAVERFLEAFAIVPFDSPCAQTYALIRADLEERGCIIGPNDLIIAATALTHRAILVTRNEREFKRVAHLQLEVWDVIDF